MCGYPIFRIVKSRMLKWFEHIARIERAKECIQHFGGEISSEQPHQRLRKI
jgi:hypothetical protein